MENNYLYEYIVKFGEEPPQTETMGYKSEIYQFLMMNAIDEGKPITPEKLDEALKNVKYDLVMPKGKKFSKFKK